VARHLYASGHSLIDAATQAARLRMRPIIMTSLAFILGVVPLVSATGAGSAALQAIGTGVIGGMITATVAVVFVPLFYVVIVGRAGRAPASVQQAAPPLADL
jgi:multidrug efflux pump